MARTEAAARGLRTLAEVAGDLPELALRTERLLMKVEGATDRGFHLSPESLEAIGRNELSRIRWTGVALWVIAIALVIQMVRA